MGLLNRLKARETRARSIPITGQELLTSTDRLESGWQLDSNSRPRAATTTSSLLLQGNYVAHTSLQHNRPEPIRSKTGQQEVEQDDYTQSQPNSEAQSQYSLPLSAKADSSRPDAGFRHMSQDLSPASPFAQVFPKPGGLLTASFANTPSSGVLTHKQRAAERYGTFDDNDEAEEIADMREIRDICDVRDHREESRNRRPYQYSHSQPSSPVKNSNGDEEKSVPKHEESSAFSRANRMLRKASSRDLGKRKNSVYQDFRSEVDLNDATSVAASRSTSSLISMSSSQFAEDFFRAPEGSEGNTTATMATTAKDNREKEEKSLSALLVERALLRKGKSPTSRDTPPTPLTSTSGFGRYLSRNRTITEGPETSYVMEEPVSPTYIPHSPEVTVRKLSTPTEEHSSSLIWRRRHGKHSARHSTAGLPHVYLREWVEKLSPPPRGMPAEDFRGRKEIICSYVDKAANSEDKESKNWSKLIMPTSNSSKQHSSLSVDHAPETLIERLEEEMQVFMREELRLGGSERLQQYRRLCLADAFLEARRSMGLNLARDRLQDMFDVDKVGAAMLVPPRVPEKDVGDPTKGGSAATHATSSEAPLPSPALWEGMDSKLVIRGSLTPAPRKKRRPKTVLVLDEKPVEEEQVASEPAAPAAAASSSSEPSLDVKDASGWKEEKVLTPSLSEGYFSHSPRTPEDNPIDLPPSQSDPSALFSKPLSPRHDQWHLHQDDMPSGYSTSRSQFLSTADVTPA